MNYFEYTKTNIPLGKKGWFANLFGSENKDTDNWDKKAGSVTIGGKTYSTKDRNDVVALQDYLIDKGYNLGVTKGTGYFGKNTQAALNKHFAGATPVTTQSSTQPQAKLRPSFFTNAKNTVSSWFTKDEEPANSWNKSTGAVSLDGKTYNTSNRNDVVALQDYLIGKGHNLGITKGNGNFGKNTLAALNTYLSKRGNDTQTEDATPWHMKVVLAINARGNNITGNPGVHAVATAIPGMYHKYIVNPAADFISQNVNENLGEEVRKAISITPGTRTNKDITPVELRIYNSIGNYLIKNNITGLDTGDINKWYRTEGYLLMKDLGYELPLDWRYSKNDLGWKTKLFNPLEKIMNVNGRMSLERDDAGNYYFTDVYDHNKSSYISDKHIDNSASQDQKSYLEVVKWLLNNAHPSDSDPDYQKHSTRIQIYS